MTRSSRSLICLSATLWCTIPVLLQNPYMATTCGPSPGQQGESVGRSRGGGEGLCGRELKGRRSDDPKCG